MMASGMETKCVNSEGSGQEVPKVISMVSKPCRMKWCMGDCRGEEGKGMVGEQGGSSRVTKGMRDVETSAVSDQGEQRRVTQLLRDHKVN